MKRILFSLAISLISTYTIANPVDPNTAKTVGLNFLASKVSSKKLGIVTDLQLVQTATDANSIPCYYVYDIIGKKGFVIVAADDICKPILGYSDESEFNTTHLPIQLKSWLSGYTHQISLSIKQHLTATESVRSNWQELLTSVSKSKTQTLDISTMGTIVVNPLIATTWDQNPDVYYNGTYYGAYNQYCPYDSTSRNHVYTGCVATAMAQVMKYWNFPKSGYGSNYYTPTNNPQYGIQSANFATTNYAWTSMPNALNAFSTTAQNDAVATLIYDCGVSVNMNYGVNGSSAFYIGGYYYNAADYALVTYFGYAPSLQGIFKMNYSDAQWLKIIENELDSSRPVLYGGQDTTLKEGHVFIADGYDNNNLIHFNWGWGGADNGYFLLSDLSPGSGVNGIYNSHQGAIIGLKPGSTPPPTIRISSFSPTVGTTGTPITIRGTGFSNNISPYGGVYFGKNATKTKSQADSIAVISDSVVVAWVGNGTSGNIYVITSAGVDSMSGFNYVPIPSVTNPKWTYLGKGFSATGAKSDVNTVCGSDNIPYIAYQDSTYKAIVMKYVNNVWTTVGTAVSTGKCSNLALLMDNTNAPIVAFADSTNSGATTIRRYNGSTWFTLGTTKLIKYNFSVALDNTNKPYFYDGKSVYTLASSVWSTYGNSQFSNANAFWNITVDKKTNLPYVVFDEFDANGYPQASVMKCSNNSWGYLGNSKFTSSSYGVYYLDIAIDTLETLLVGMQEDNGYERGSVYQYKNGGWSTLGGPHFTKSHTYYPFLAIDRKNSPLLLYNDLTYNGNGTVMSYSNSSSWSLLGERGFAPSLSFGRNSIVANANNDILVAFIDNSQANKVSVMKYNGSPLPIKLLSFDASYTEQSNIQLTWQTTNEQNTSNFIVQSSTNGMSFTTIGSVIATGIGNNSYRFLVNNPVAAINYYRLACVDKDGNVVYGKTVEIKIRKQENMSVFPNPAKNILNVSILDTISEQVLLLVTDLMGKVVLNQKVHLDAGNNKISLLTDNLEKGNYIVVIKGNSTQLKKFIKN